MKTLAKRTSILLVTACALMGGLVQGRADVTVKVDSTLPWLGFMNVWLTNGTSYQFGSAWALADLRGGFIPTNSPSGWPLNTSLVLEANTNTYNPTNSYWNFPDGSPNKIVEANFYRDVGTNYAGQTVTFTGTVLSNTLPAPSGGLPASGWTSVCFVKEFSVGYGTFFGSTEVPLAASGAFTVSRPIGAGHVSQYGFYVKGPNVAPLSANSFKGIGVLVEDSDPAITNQPLSRTIPSGISTNLSVGAIGSAPLSYQWKTNGVDLVNGPKYSGVTTKTLGIANSQVGDSAAYVVTVSNTVTTATVDSTPAQLTVLDILIITNPVSQRVEQGSTVVLSVSASSSSSLSYQWKSVIGGVTNSLSNGPSVSGVTTPTLTLSNVQVAMSGQYFVTLTTLAGVANAGANLVVKSYADYANFLENPGFESDPTGVNESPWFRFSSTSSGFGHFQSTNDTYFLGGNVNVYDGLYVSFTSYNDVYSGIYQDVAAQPGQVFAASMWFYNASGDPIPGPSASATNENYIEIQFRAGDNPTPIRQYTTALPSLTYATPMNVWFQLQATNAGTYGYNPSTNNAKYLVAPDGTTSVRFQLTMHDLGGSVGAGSVYYDDAALMLKLPVTVSAVQSGGNLVMSWKSQGATSYQVQYADTLGGPWLNLGATVPGTGLVVSKSDPTTHVGRYYRVLTL